MKNHPSLLCKYFPKNPFIFSVRFNQPSFFLVMQRLGFSFIFPAAAMFQGYLIILLQSKLFWSARIETPTLTITTWAVRRLQTGYSSHAVVSHKKPWQRRARHHGQREPRERFLEKVSKHCTASQSLADTWNIHISLQTLDHHHHSDNWGLEQRVMK